MVIKVGLQRKWSSGGLDKFVCHWFTFPVRGSDAREFALTSRLAPRIARGACNGRAVLFAYHHAGIIVLLMSAIMTPLSQRYYSSLRLMGRDSDIDYHACALESFGGYL